MNDKATSSNTPIGDDSDSNQGYYNDSNNDGFIRNIKIELNEKSSITNTSNQDLANGTINNTNSSITTNNNL